ncbi:MAG: hypothetical protein K2O00_05920 [Muribaculaceae bacterium]|nr:hypothetical protein [Muribaculaceae bacterium]
MKKFFTFCLMAVSMLPAAWSQNRDVKIPTESNLGITQTDYSQLKTGFFCVGQVATAYTFNAKPLSIGFTDLEGIAGYRFSDYLRAGVGIGVRYYYNVNDVRNMSHKFGMPLFLDLRGNFIPNDYRNVVPFWSVDLGATFPDGVMFRPSIGARVGQPRSAFIVSLGYVGQNIRTYTDEVGTTGKSAHKFASGVSLSIGYEF